MDKVFLNDKVIDTADAKVSANDSGFLYGMGLFETMRCNNGKVFAVDAHMERLFNSAKELEMDNTYTKEYVKDAIGKTLEANELTDARLRLTLTGGPMGNEVPESTLLITATEFVPYPQEYYQKGVTVVLTDRRQNAHDSLNRHKTTNYFARLLALNEARKKKAGEALWFSTENFLAEGCISNVFVVKDGVVQTPGLDTPVLPGIMRGTVIEAAVKEKMTVEEGPLVISDLLGADEVFLTNVIMGVLPVTGVEAKAIGDGKPGEITKKLSGKINELMGK
ncbi:MAG: aminotransferase class IV family protein [Planctomycetes bacterium]|nr:aminotransferase class IV family protein [Planctomycetota bacterium]